MVSAVNFNGVQFHREVVMTTNGLRYFAQLHALKSPGFDGGLDMAAFSKTKNDPSRGAIRSATGSVISGLSGEVD